MRHLCILIQVRCKYNTVYIVIDTSYRFLLWKPTDINLHTAFTIYLADTTNDVTVVWQRVLICCPSHVNKRRLNVDRLKEKDIIIPILIQ